MPSDHAYHSHEEYHGTAKQRGVGLQNSGIHDKKILSTGYGPKTNRTVRRALENIDREKVNEDSAEGRLVCRDLRICYRQARRLIDSVIILPKRRGSGRPMRETFLLSISDMYRISLICGCVRLSVGMMEGRGSMKMKICCRSRSTI